MTFQRTSELWVSVMQEHTQRLLKLEKTVSEIRGELCELKAAVDALRRHGPRSGS